MWSIISLVFIVRTACDSGTGYVLLQLGGSVQRIPRPKMTSLCKWTSFILTIDAKMTGMRNGVDFFGGLHGIVLNSSTVFVVSRQIKCSNLGIWSFSGRIFSQLFGKLRQLQFQFINSGFTDQLGLMWFWGNVEGFWLDFRSLFTGTALKLGLPRSLQVSPWPGLTPLCRFWILPYGLCLCTATNLMKPSNKWWTECEKGKAQPRESGSPALVFDVAHFPTSLESNLHHANQYPSNDQTLQLYTMCFQNQCLTTQFKYL